MEITNNKLIELPSKEWVKLRNMYLKDWPQHSTQYNAIDNAIRLMSMQAEGYGIQIQTLNGDWQRDATFIMTINPDDDDIFLGTLNGDLYRLKKAVELLDTTVDWYFDTCNDRLKPVVYHYAKVNNFTYTTWCVCTYQFLKKADGLQLEIPKHDENIILKPLRESDAETVHNLWEYKRKNSLGFIRRLITTDFSIGAYDTNSDELLAWCLRYPTGSLGVLQVKPKYFRMGLGKLVTIAQIRQLAEHGLDSFAEIVFTNKVSRRLFANLGFREAGSFSWMCKEVLDICRYENNK